MRCGLGVILLVATTACADRDPAWPLGSPADRHTAAGAYDGFRVVAPCPGLAGDDVGVIGTGAVAVTGAEVAVRGGELYARIGAGAHGDVLFGGGGTAIPCDGGATTTLFVGDWRVVDDVIADTGAWLRANDLALEVAIDVTGPFVPVDQ